MVQKMKTNKLFLFMEVNIDTTSLFIMVCFRKIEGFICTIVNINKTIFAKTDLIKSDTFFKRYFVILFYVSHQVKIV